MGAHSSNIVLTISLADGIFVGASIEIPAPAKNVYFSSCDNKSVKFPSNKSKNSSFTI